MRASARSWSTEAPGARSTVGRNRLTGRRFPRGLGWRIIVPAAWSGRTDDALTAARRLNDRERGEDDLARETREAGRSAVARGDRVGRLAEKEEPDRDVGGQHDRERRPAHHQAGAGGGRDREAAGDGAACKPGEGEDDGQLDHDRRRLADGRGEDEDAHDTEHETRREHGEGVQDAGEEGAGDHHCRPGPRGARAVSFVTAGDGEAAARVARALAAVEAEEKVRILLAAEAGSRAFGFPSPGSDLDVRFIYVHCLDWYLSITPRRDVVERLGDGLDLVGWDARKALGLLVRQNPALLEWLGSPVRYRWNGPLAEALASLGRRATPAPAAVHHYRRLCERIHRAEIAGRERVAPKHYLHAVRAALASRHARRRDDPPPVPFAALLAAANLAADEAREVRAVLEAKRAGEAYGPRRPCLDALIEAEIAAEPPPSPPRDPSVEGEADTLFRRIVKGEVLTAAARSPGEEG